MLRGLDKDGPAFVQKKQPPGFQLFGGVSEFQEDFQIFPQDGFRDQKKKFAFFPKIGDFSGEPAPQVGDENIGIYDNAQFGSSGHAVFGLFL